MKSMAALTFLIIGTQAGGASDENDTKTFYESSDNDSDKDRDGAAGAAAGAKQKPYVMDMDHRLLLRTCRPLLNSRNAAVSGEG